MAVFGGLLTSTVLTLIVIPVVYELIEDGRSWLLGRTGLSPAAMLQPAPAEPLVEAGYTAAERIGGD
jgi:hypothetical protein